MNDSVAALFVRHDSVYKTMPNVDCYDLARDARTWPGGCPVIVHPPCRTWGRLKAFAKAPDGEHGLAIWAAYQVMGHGGVLEHPAGSDLWPEKATLFHDAGAIARCYRCGRYTISPDALRAQCRLLCDCGSTDYWTGSFCPPTKYSKWLGDKEGVHTPV